MHNIYLGNWSHVSDDGGLNMGVGEDNRRCMEQYFEDS